ncbi:MAG: hypothetical protein GVY08_07785 [Bacteroidetes bacterium]|nr:hypothetical protein [Bacteroidota bacterium]NBC26745.1 hypothetical protein [Bacteroidota bacterium]
MHLFTILRRLLAYSLLPFLVLLSSPAFTPSDAEAQNMGGTETEIIFTEEKREQAREQLRRILATYDLDPWIITNEVKIEEEVDPHSKPILTLNTNFLDSDKMQLAIFIHEQAHWLPFDKQVAAAEELAELFPDIDGLPDMDEVSEEKRERLLDIKDRIYRHIVVGWTEFDGMVELVGEEEARKIIKEKNNRFVEKPYSNLGKTFLWYFERVLEDTEVVGGVLAQHDLMITPGKGIVIESSE